MKKNVFFTMAACVFASHLLSQNVGIGAATPLAKLHVVSTSGNEVLRLQNASVPTLKFFQNTQEAGSLAASYGNFFNLYSTNGFIGIYPNGIFSTAFGTNGYVGMGTTLPSARLHVYSTSSLTVPNMLIEESTASYARQTFKNANGKSFTIAGLANASADVLNIYSEKIAKDLMTISSDNKQNIKLNGSIVQGSIMTVNSANGQYLGDFNADGVSVIRFTGDVSTLGGITNGVEGRTLYIEYDGSNDIILGNNQSDIPAGDRFLLPGGEVTILNNLHSVILIYLGGGWRLMSKT